MNLLCFLFGHRPIFDYMGKEGTGYFQTEFVTVDGINRHHYRLICPCERCGETYQVGMIHIPYTYVEDQQRIDKLAARMDSQADEVILKFKNVDGSFRHAVDNI